MNGIQITIGDDVRAAWQRFSDSQEPANAASAAYHNVLKTMPDWQAREWRDVGHNAKSQSGVEFAEKVWLKKNFGPNAVRLYLAYKAADAERQAACHAFYAFFERGSSDPLCQIVVDMLKAGK